MGASNYAQMDQYIAECTEEDVADLVKYENTVMKSAGTDTPKELDADSEGFNFLDFVRGYIAQKFCVYKVTKRRNLNLAGKLNMRH